MTKKDLEAKVEQLNRLNKDSNDRIEALKKIIRKMENDSLIEKAAILDLENNCGFRSIRINNAIHTINVGVDILYPDLDLSLPSSELIEPEEAFIKRIYRDLI